LYFSKLIFAPLAGLEMQVTQIRGGADDMLATHRWKININPFVFATLPVIIILPESITKVKQ
jgi:hypothetical protein